LEELADLEGELQRLARVEARVAESLVVECERLVGDLAVDALGHFARRELEMNPPRGGAFLLMRNEEGLDLRQDVIEGPGLVAGPTREGVAVHRVAYPRDRTALVSHRPQQGR
jgi:hypothetical protein